MTFEGAEKERIICKILLLLNKQVRMMEKLFCNTVN